MRLYFTARGSAIPVITTGRKAIEEATELVEAIAEGDAAHIREEVADLALVAAVVAAQYGSTVESCIAEKANRDTGRGEPPEYARLSVADGPGPEERLREELRPWLEHGAECGYASDTEFDADCYCGLVDRLAALSRPLPENREEPSR